MAEADGEGVLRDATVWRAADFDGPGAWTVELSEAMAAEIETAAAAVVQRDLSYQEIGQDDFPLPVCAPLFEQVRAELDTGRGFAVLSGYPVHRHGYRENVAAFCGVSSYLGRIGAQNAKGETVVDVVDQGLPYDHASRGYNSNKRLPFHTDGADIAGLLCLGVSASGGDSLIASASALYNEVSHRRPDLLDTLTRGFRHHRRGEEPPGEPPVSARPIPVFSFHNGLLHCCYNRNPIEWAQREGVTLSERDVDALDVVDAVAGDPAFHVQMDLKVGDMQFVNNYAVLHSRTEYADDVAAGGKRHLVRVWLNMPVSERAGPTLQNLYAPAAARFPMTA